MAGRPPATRTGAGETMNYEQEKVWGAKYELKESVSSESLREPPNGALYFWSSPGTISINVIGVSGGSLLVPLHPEALESRVLR